MHDAIELEPGVTLLDVPAPRSTVVHRLTCARLATVDGPAYWIDARNAAATHALYDCAASPSTLADLAIARAFTAYQHHSLVRDVTRRADPETSLLVAPNVAALYHDADLPEWEREDLLAASLETLAELGRVLDCPVLVTGTDEGRIKRVSEYADATIDCTHTREGLCLERVDGDGDRGATVDGTAGYWNGGYWQTTIPHWVDVCGAAATVDSVVAAHDRGLLEVIA